ncbi:50S ribosomal protein L4 [Candidatus Saccharibacteria bacterium]|nr:50S ribosomal protein L4 [Candidatus Saccharibacteria bacterium]
MAVATYSKSGTKATTPAKLDKAIFGVEVKDHQLLKEAYLSYLANGRTNNAVTKKRGQVSGGGRKPWRQKGTGNARFGSSRNPIWRGGGVAFGPTGQENYTRKLSQATKHRALRQALSMAAKEDRIKVIDSFVVSDGKTKSAANLFKKLDAKGPITMVVANKEDSSLKAVRNLNFVDLTSAKYLSVYKVMNSSCLVFEKAALEIVSEWLSPSTGARSKEGKK